MKEHWVAYALVYLCFVFMIGPLGVAFVAAGLKRRHERLKRGIIDDAYARRLNGD